MHTMIQSSVSFHWHSHLLVKALHVLFPCRMILLRPIICRPHRLSHKQPHQLDIVISVKGEPVVNSSRQDDQITSLDPNTNPTIIFVPNIKVPTPFQTVTYLFVCVNVLCVEVPQLLLIILHFLRAQIQQILQNYEKKAR